MDQMACVVVSFFFESLAEARADVDVDGVSQDAVGVYSCFDVEGRGGCAIFAALVGCRPDWMPHAAEVPVAAGRFFAPSSPLEKVSAKERYIEAWVRERVRCLLLNLLLVSLADVFCVRVVGGEGGVPHPLELAEVPARPLVVRRRLHVRGSDARRANPHG